MNVQTVHKNTNYLKQGLWEYVMRKSGPTAAPPVNDSSSKVDVRPIKIPSKPSPSHASPKTTIIVPSSTTSPLSRPPIATSAVVSVPRSKVHSSDSIGNEMTHFKPIRLMPISEKHPAITDDIVLKVPTVRYKDAATAIYTPAKSCFHPESPLKIRNSAFCLVAPAADGFQQENKLVPVKRKLPASLPANNGSSSSQSYSVQSGTKSKQQKLMCNIAIDETNRRRILMQEKADFELAKMLQEFDADVPPPSTNGTNSKSRKTSARTTKRSAAVSSSSSSGCTVTTSGVTENNEHNALINGDSVRTRRYFLRNRSKADQSNSSSSSSSVSGAANGVRGPNKATASSRLKKRYNH